jgi:trehalose 6-phosphate phosphatase
MTQSMAKDELPAAGIPSALDQIDKISEHAGKIAVFLDYDGTLTPIVSRPELAGLADSTRQTVRALATRVLVTILSGRDREDIRRAVGIDGIVYAGSHGFDLAGPRGLRKEVATEFLPILDAAEKELREKLAGVPGALLERKKFSIAAHYRNANERGAAKVKRVVDQAVERHHELRRIVGKKVYELQPDIDWHKGKALIWLLESMRAEQPELFPIYIGDDTTDEDAFRALQQRGAGILVSDQPRPTAARYMLKGPAEVERFLQELSARVQTDADS